MIKATTTAGKLTADMLMGAMRVMEENRADDYIITVSPETWDKLGRPSCIDGHRVEVCEMVSRGQAIVRKESLYDRIRRKEQ